MTSIKGWSKFQHFRDRKPPWIKLYRDILDDIEWHELDPEAAKVLVMLWLIASEDEGNLPDEKRLAFRLRISESKVKTMLSKLSHWLKHDDIATISDKYQDDLIERERETELETETEKKEVGSSEPDPVLVAFNDWNKLAEEIGLAKALKLTDQRRRALKARLDDCGGIVGWVKVMDAVRNSPFLKGQNDRNWQADLDFVLKASSFIKIQEGKYAPKNGFSSIDWKKVLGDDFDPAASV